MVDTRDILLKAAEDVTQGMWCKDIWFMAGDIDQVTGWTMADHDIEQAMQSRRCAEGSIAVATKLLGGTYNDYEKARNSAQMACIHQFNATLVGFNDDYLPDDPFEAGQQLAELFRSTAEALGRR